MYSSYYELYYRLPVYYRPDLYFKERYKHSILTARGIRRYQSYFLTVQISQQIVFQKNVYPIRKFIPLLEFCILI